MNTRTVYVKPHSSRCPPVLSAGRLTPGELYHVIVPAEVEGVIVLATSGPWHIRSVVVHSGHPSVYPVGMAVTDDSWRFRRLGVSEYVQLIQGYEQ
ncbi:hypothetical protein phiKMVp07 [Pseudomonas phage phiKMV]|uniref:Uncharacterized protein n=2 Tax=Phikmvvirus TaxID=477967 RepID=Q7Y2F8_BPKMV|nr:hypothetical protein phiKMVp07 [Pseudomonas phage phiKMV]YP_002117788.1 hypothetical protein PT2_gp09 [Pseudomonas phage PT2]ABY70974.1 conserved hypothetical phage protein [Pseudomonas phage PT2]CAD44198.1 hypothetical protein [Pseudomonas phage phiKMV]